jgi:flavocytochrome c
VLALLGILGFALAEPAPDVLVVGAGISGLSTALEAARGGASVLVVDMWSIFGGHAVMSHGGLCIVGTPVQEAAGIQDAPELAERDFLTWGEDADPGWVRLYARSSRALIYDWVSEMGVTFSGGVSPVPGNSVARFHNPDGRGLGLVSPIYRACLENGNVRFRWNFKVEGLVVEEGRVTGIRGHDMRSGEAAELRGSEIVLATGGFQSNLEMVREHWPRDLPFPERFLIGSGVNSVGSGHAIAKGAGAALFSMDHQWNYATGLPDPRYPGGGRGLNASNDSAIWVNLDGKRFVNELESVKAQFPAVLRQREARYWALFDEKTKRRIFVSGSDWADFDTVERTLLENGELVKKAETIEEIARLARLPADALVETLMRYNRMAKEGVDSEFGRPELDPIDTPPYYALPFFPLSRKSMGGVRIDLETRVLDGSGDVIPGLYAVGELAGFGGINGKAGLEGTFLGPSIVTGRVAGRAILKSLGKRMTRSPPTATARRMPVQPAGDLDQTPCVTCHDLGDLIATPRRGYSHFENVHRVVSERGLSCGSCHREMFPYDADRHQIDRLAQVETCRTCHLASER